MPCKCQPPPSRPPSPHTLINLRGLVFQLFPIRNSLWRRFQVWRQDNYYINTFINLRAFMATLKFCLIWQRCTEALSLFPEKNLACFTIPDINLINFPVEAVPSLATTQSLYRFSLFLMLLLG